MSGAQDRTAGSRPGDQAADAKGQGEKGRQAKGWEAKHQAQACAREVFEYALLRVVPRVERGETMNAGVVLYCRARSLVIARTHLDEARLRALDPGSDVEGVRAALRAAEAVCEGGDGAGPPAAESPGSRFRWLVAPRSTVVQPGPVHTGLTCDPEAEAERLLGLLVR